MFCPECRTEYEEGYTECSDCRIPLVWELPSETKTEYLEFVTVLSGDPALFAMAKSILESAEIKYIAKNERGPYPSFPIIIQVAKNDEQEARQLLEDL
jgi:Putative prokaryotic signal transducing protein